MTDFAHSPHFSYSDHFGLEETFDIEVLEGGDVAEPAYINIAMPTPSSLRLGPL